MVLHDDRTGRGHPLPHPDNLLEDDVLRLRAAIDGLDRDATALESGKADADLSNVPAAAFKAKAAAAGLSLPAVTAGDAGKSLIVNPAGTGYQVGAAGSAIQQSGPLYAPGGSGFSLTGRSVVAAYEQIAGQTFNIGYTTESDYAQQDAANGTDASGGAFVLHNTAGAVIDNNTKLLIHADGVNGSTEIIDERGITPFGTHCAYFMDDSGWMVPASYKIAFGAGDFTLECWVRPEEAPSSTTSYFFDTRSSGIDGAFFAYEHSINKFRFNIGNGVVSGQSSFTSASKQWHHVALVRLGTAFTLYVDGVVAATATSSYALVATSISIGKHFSATGYGLIGWMDQVRVSKIARYTAAFTPPIAEFTTDTDTVHLFQFNDGHGTQFIRDASKSGHEVALSADGSGCALTNTRSKFGVTSLNLPSISSYDAAVIGYSKPHSDMNFGSDDFTIDCWVYATSFLSTSTIWAFMGDTYGLTLRNNSGAITLYASTANTSYNVTINVGAATAGQWVHYAVTRSGTSLYAFANGVLAGTAGVGTSSLVFSTQKVAVGNRPGSSGYALAGQVDEFRIKRGQAAWTSNFTPPTAPYATDDYTVLLCHFEGANGDKMTLDSSESSYGTNGFGDTTTPALSFAGSATLDTTYTRGGNSTSLKLNGTSQYAQLLFAQPSAGHPMYFANAEKWCLEGWFYLSSLASGQQIIDLGGTTTTARLSCLLGGSGEVNLIFNGSTAARSGTVAASIGMNHVALVREGRGYYVYVNGVVGNGVTGNPHREVTYPAEPGQLTLGSVYGGGSYLTGAIDSFRITHGKPRYEANFTPGNLTQDADTALLWVFNGASGQKWVKELSKNTALISSTNARTVKDGRYIPGPASATAVTKSTLQSKFGNASLLFPNSSDAYLDLLPIPEFGFSADYTIECWVRRSATGVVHTIASKSGGSSATAAWYLEASAADKARFVHFSGSTATSLLGTTSLTANTWYHIAAVRSGTTIYLFVNGTSEATATGTGSMNTTTNPTRIGVNYDSANFNPFNGHLDEFRISNTARWTANFTPPTLPYGQQYVTGPHWVATKPGASSLDLSAFSSIDSASFSGGTPPTTSLTYLISTDGYATPLKRWTGSAWVATAHGMTWAAPTLTTTATAAQLNAVGNSWAELSAGLAALDVSAVGSLNVVAVLSTANPQYTPSLDAITLNMDEYQLMQPGADYTVRRRKANGVQTLTFTRVKAGNANHVVDCVG